MDNQTTNPEWVIEVLKIKEGVIKQKTSDTNAGINQ